MKFSTQLRRRVVDRLRAQARHCYEIDTQAAALDICVKEHGGVDLKQQAKTLLRAAEAIEKRIELIRDPRGPWK